MSIGDGSEPISEEEILYRRIPVSKNWYNPDKDPPLSPEAFNPIRVDSTGFSITRGKYLSIQEAAKGSSSGGYYVAVFKAGDLQAVGINIVPRPLNDNPGHAEITDITYDERKSENVRRFKGLMGLKLCKRVEGPFKIEPGKDSQRS